MESIQTAPEPKLFEVPQGNKTASYVALPPNWRGEFAKDPALQHTPEVVNETTSVANSPSFLTYFNRFKDERTLVTASRSGQRLIAHLDYHLNAGNPSPNRHSLIRVYKTDRRFNEWLTHNGKSFGQVRFAEFLEDRMLDVRSPEHADLLQSIVKFKALRSSACNSVIEGNGDVRFEFVQSTSSPAGGVVLPERIAIRVPVLEFEDEWDIHARLRYELNEGKVSFKYELIAIDDVTDLAFRTAIADLGKQAAVSVILTD